MHEAMTKPALQRGSILYQIYLRNITAGIEVDPSGIVVSAAPVLKNSVGLKVWQVRDWVKGKGGEMIPVRGERIKEHTH